MNDPINVPSSPQVELNIENNASQNHKLLTTTKKNSSSLEKIVSAFTGAIITMTFMNPLDVVKTRLQETTKNGKTEYKGTIDCLSKIFRNEGTFALWRGLIPGLVMALPSTAIYFVGYDYIRDHIKNSRFEYTTLDIYSPLWAGGLARTMAALVVSPLELFRTRMQSKEGIHGFSDVWLGVKRMVHLEGPQALWRGLLPTMLRDVPFSAVYWMGYEKIKHQLILDNSNQSHFQIAFISGATSGMMAAIITTPFDVIKTQRQVSSGADEAKLNNILKNIILKDGLSGFFKGVVPRVAKVAPGCAIMISSYEMGKHFFSSRRL
ncbi:mitochondrial carrier domain-containing protein [Cokeromyces recurvatus]|uniref:mitochondrial carrier domain-containing protein n=1 Tax=Cokeromyces recurvatus TaxID=90255 RepID=UPI00221EB5FB|nr:mitochondrial carrier domain-containing protein [Cokeromyces recurvatus]KAI7904881.1 mitochondrial carrier domain-containing protein [Cokeromyces recurvatus]